MKISIVMIIGGFSLSDAFTVAKLNYRALSPNCLAP
jgi:hypothetical protein